MSYIDIKYINLVSSRFDRFSWKSKTIATCRCPICGDSKKNKAKKRFYFFLDKKKNKYFVKCHNCGYSVPFSRFLQRTDEELYKNYLFEEFSNNKTQKEIIITYDFEDSMDRIRENPLLSLSTIESLNKDHCARKYIEARKIPHRYYKVLYYAENYKEFALKIDPEKTGLLDEPRIVIPFFDKDGKLFAAQGRSLNKKDYVKYVTVTDKAYKGSKYYGLERHDSSMKTYITEGPLDSLFLPNAIGIAGSNLNDNLPCSKELAVVVYDNEPRNKEILNKIQQAINKGYNVCIWPDYIKEKDINDIILSGKNPQDIIDNNTYNGLMANLKFKEWSKV